MEHLQLQLGDLVLHAVSSGDGRPIILLHGFPEFWYSWRTQIPALAAAGFRPIAVDLRGYNLSEKPPGIRAYSVECLVADVVTLIERHAGGQAFVVGHDWGGVIAWRLAALHPHLVRRLVVLNAPHPGAYRRLLANSFTQWLRSSYVLLFQFPWLAEALLRAGDFWLIERAFRQSTNPLAFPPADIVQYKKALNQPGALTAALNYYRAALWHSDALFGAPQTVDVPTLLIWGERDNFLDRQLTFGLERWVPNLRVVRLKNASHWVQHDQPDVVNRLLIDFFSLAAHE